MIKIFLYHGIQFNVKLLKFQGKTGDWKNHFRTELNHRIDEWIDKNLAGSDLKFVTELEYQV